MGVTIGEYNFSGPFSSEESLEDKSGIYAVLDRRVNGLIVLDIGESAMVKERISKHDRRLQWILNLQGEIAYAVYYTPSKQQAGRKELEKKLRLQYDPPCGER